MSGYELTRQWFDFQFENPDKSDISQAALYMWLIELNNRKGFAEKFIFNTEDACMYTGIKNRKTVWTSLHKLVENGFVTVVKKAQNQNQTTTISIIKNKVKSNGCLDKSLRLSKFYTSDTLASKQQVNSNGTSDTLAVGHSNKQETNKLGNEETLPQQVAFDTFWDLYDKKVDAKACRKKWDKLKTEDQYKALQHIPKYVNSTPEKQFRKNPETYLNDCAWENEILFSSNNPEKKEVTVKPSHYNTPKAYYETCLERKVIPVHYWTEQVLTEEQIQEEFLKFNVGKYA